ncbi:MAG: pentapeptide repeat-containing protein, partial [Dehalococcoidia bacterium]|nr:pentapeptide repeat-containing protein [Dehalococcoidia bacterium]
MGCAREGGSVIEIKHRDGRAIYVAEHAQDVRAALIQAVREGADLGDAYLRGAYLRGANLRGANLGGADLGGA